LLLALLAVAALVELIRWRAWPTPLPALHGAWDGLVQAQRAPFHPLSAHVHTKLASVVGL